MLNLPGIVGMAASLELLLSLGIDAISARILELRRGFLDRLRTLGYRHCLEAYGRPPDTAGADLSGIISVSHPEKDLPEVARRLQADIVVSLRHNRAGEAFLRFSPHFYTEAELDHVLGYRAVLRPFARAPRAFSPAGDRRDEKLPELWFNASQRRIIHITPQIENAWRAA